MLKRLGKGRQVAERALQSAERSAAEREAQYRTQERTWEADRLALAEELSECRSALLQTASARGEAEGRARELETRLAATERAHALTLESAEARAWSLSEEHGQAMQRLIQERAELQAELRELRTRVALDPGPLDPGSLERARRIRARVLLGLSGVSLGMGAMLVPGLLLALGGGERARYYELATGLDAARLLAAMFGLLAVALGTGTWGWRELMPHSRAVVDDPEAAAVATAGPTDDPVEACEGALASQSGAA